MRNSNLMFLSFILLTVFSCAKDTNYGSDPYGGSTESTNVKFIGDPFPSQIRPGETVTYKVAGLASLDRNELLFYVNNTPTDIVSSTDSTITVRVGLNISTGSARLEFKGQIFAGPLTPIIGKLNVDPTFNPGTGTIGGINTIVRLSNGQFFLAGAFTDYNGKSSEGEINGIVRINSTGEYITGMKFGEGAKGGSIGNILELPDGKLFISGNFNRYDGDETVRSATVLNNLGSINKEAVTILNLTDNPNNNSMLVPVFNGGVIGGVVKSFLFNNKITMVGAFQQFTSNYYPRSTFNNILRDFFKSENIVRLNLDGSLDSTFLVNHNVFPKRGSFGVNGAISDAVMDANGDLMLVGSFTNYNNTTTANRVLKLKNDGSVDGSMAISPGADNSIFKIVPTLNNKYYLVGSFLNFNGSAVNQIVLINADGTIDPSFRAQAFSGGSPNYLTVLDNGMLLVTGTFLKYNDVIREGLMILNPDGSLASGHNNTGRFLGTVRDSYQGYNSIGQRTVTLVGSIVSFNGVQDLGNIIRLTIQD